RVDAALVRERMGRGARPRNLDALAVSELRHRDRQYARRARRASPPRAARVCRPKRKRRQRVAAGVLVGLLFAALGRSGYSLAAVVAPPAPPSPPAPAAPPPAPPRPLTTQLAAFIGHVNWLIMQVQVRMPIMPRTMHGSSQVSLPVHALPAAQVI